MTIGAGIGVAGVLLTGVVKDRLAARAGAVTGGYVVAMMVGSTVASAAAVPLAVLLGGWSLALAAWAVPALLAVAAWFAGGPADAPTGSGRAAAAAALARTRSPGGPAATRPAPRCWSTAG